MRRWWTAVVLSMAALLALKLSWWLVVLLWFPVTILIQVLLMTASAELKAPPIESDTPHGSPPDSALGLKQ
jgi:hypothetical protein